MTKTVAELWVAIPGHSGYEASSLGRIRSIDRDVVVGGPRAHVRRNAGRVLRTFSAGAGYEYVKLGKGVSVGVNRLIAMAFHGEPPFEGAEAAHGDGDKLNNLPRNIAWKTKRENEADKLEHGTYFTRGGVKGERHHKAKLSDRDVCAIRAAFTGTRGEKTRLAAQYRVNRSTIARVVGGMLWSHV